MSELWPSGLVTALVTPLRNEALDVAALRELIEFQVAAGVSGFVVAGGTGEYGALNPNERKALAREVIEATPGRLAVVVQTGSLATRDAIELSVDAQSAGASGILVGSPIGDPLTWPERLQFYRDVTNSVSLPVMIYNTPSAGLLTLEQINQLAELPNVSAIKDSSGDPTLMGDLLATAHVTGLDVYVGADSYVVDAIAAGARGCVLGAASFMPEPLVQIVRAVQTRNDAGIDTELRELWEPTRATLRFLETSTNYIALCKAACTLRGIDVGPVRRPFLMPDDAEISELISRFRRIPAFTP